MEVTIAMASKCYRHQHPLPNGVTWTNVTCVLKRGLKSAFPSVRKCVASALGKYARANEPAIDIVLALADQLAIETNPQTRQYVAKALGCYGARAVKALPELKDASRDMTMPEYVRTAAAEAVAAIQSAHREHFARTHHWCARCRTVIGEEQFRATMSRWGRAYCLHCADEVALEGRNFEATVEGAKKLRTSSGNAVQSVGEKRIAEFLEQCGIEYVYDERYLVAGDLMIRPDFYLPEFDVYIEYWGMDTPEYRQNMAHKKRLYQREGKKLVSVGFADFDEIESLLEEKLSKYFRVKRVG